MPGPTSEHDVLELLTKKSVARAGEPKPAPQASAASAASKVREGRGARGRGGAEGGVLRRPTTHERNLRYMLTSL